MGAGAVLGDVRGDFLPAVLRQLQAVGFIETEPVPKGLRLRLQAMRARARARLHCTHAHAQVCTHGGGLQREALHWKGDEGYLVVPPKSHDKLLLQLFAALLQEGTVERGAATEEYYKTAPSAAAVHTPCGAAKSTAKGEADFELESLMEALVPCAGTLQRLSIPDGLAMRLFPFQEEGLGWMMRMETDRTAGGDVLHPLWDEYVLPEGQILYVNRVCGTLSSTRYGYVLRHVYIYVCI